MPYLLDTDCLIEALAGNQKIVTTIERLSAQRLAVSLISLGEIYHGAYVFANPPAHLSVFRQFIAPFRVLPLTDSIMERFGEIRALLQRRGETIPDFDLLIGATALCHHLTVLTLNVKDFERIPDVQLYKPN